MDNDGFLSKLLPDLIWLSISVPFIAGAFIAKTKIKKKLGEYTDDSFYVWYLTILKIYRILIPAIVFFELFINETTNMLVKHISLPFWIPVTHFLLLPILITILMISFYCIYSASLSQKASRLKENIIDRTEIHRIFENEIIPLVEKNTSPDYLVLDGVFAVSAIIFDKGKFILTRDGATAKWKQPGRYFRSNRILKRAGATTEQLDEMKLEIPYKYLRETLDGDSGLSESVIEFLDLDDTGYTRVVQTHSLNGTVQRVAQHEIESRDNLISPLPFLIQFEASDRIKSSARKKHLDLFYAFTTKVDFSLLEYKKYHEKSATVFKQIESFTIEEIKEKTDEDLLYSDIYDICLEFLKKYRKSKFQNKKIRYCTFNQMQETIWIRLSEECNSSCVYCLMNGTKKTATFGAVYNFDKLIDSIVNEKMIFDNTKHKLVITGGEPLLYSNLFDGITLLLKNQFGPLVGAISICTNGTLWREHQDAIRGFVNIISIPKKFVINLSSYNESTYEALTGQSCFSEVINFLTFLKKEEIDFEINVVMTAYLADNLNNYIDFWNKNEIKKISLSYAIKTDENIKTTVLLSKEKCIEIYKKLFSGEYEIERFEQLELMIPDCNDNYCNGSDHIITVSQNEKIEYDICKRCIL